jgi:transcriptional regulator with XRE-family HTH domain
VDPLRFGRHYRALRVRLRRRQVDVAFRAGLSRSLIASIDRGEIDGVTVGSLVRACTALGADVDLRLRWRGEQLDRLLDEDHATIVEAVVARLERSGWSVDAEVSFSIWGERGSIDVFAFHPANGALLVIEVKSVVPDSQATLHGLDRKARLAAQIAASRDWRPRHVSRLLVIRESATSRRRIARLAATYDAVLPARGSQVGRWLRNPDRPVAGLIFLPVDSHSGAKRIARGPDRVNPTRSARVVPESRSDAVDDVI